MPAPGPEPCRERGCGQRAALAGPVGTRQPELAPGARAAPRPAAPHPGAPEAWRVIAFQGCKRAPQPGPARRGAGPCDVPPGSARAEHPRAPAWPVIRCQG